MGHSSSSLLSCSSDGGKNGAILLSKIILRIRFGSHLLLFSGYKPHGRKHRSSTGWLLLLPMPPVASMAGALRARYCKRVKLNSLRRALRFSRVSPRCEALRARVQLTLSVSRPSVGVASLVCSLPLRPSSSLYFLAGY